MCNEHNFNDIICHLNNIYRIYKHYMKICNYVCIVYNIIFSEIILIYLLLYLRMGFLDQWQQCKLQVTPKQLWEVWFVAIASCHREMLLYSFQYSVNFSGSSFDPLGQARGPASPLEKKTSDRFVQFCIAFFQSIDSNRKPTMRRVWKHPGSSKNLEGPNSELAGIMPQTLVHVVGWLSGTSDFSGLWLAQ